MHRRQWYVRESVRMDLGAAGPGAFLFPVLLFVNAFFVAAEYAFIRVRSTQLDELAEQGSARAKAAKQIVGSLDAYISATQIGVTLASLGLGLVGEPAVGRLLDPLFSPLDGISTAVGRIVSFIVSFGLVTYLTVVVGELAPKYLALERTIGLALWCAYPLEVFARVMRPFIWFVNGSANAIVRWFGIKPVDDLNAHSEEELKMLVAISTRKGILQESERVLLGNALDFADTLVRHVMVPRTEIVGVPDDIRVEGIIRLTGQNPFTRFPVYHEDIDHIVGIIHLKDVVRAAPGTPVSDLMRKPLYLPESTHLDRALAQFRREHIQLAIVVDEFGGTAGLVTLEDVIEELVGEVQDEFDRETPMIREEEGSFLINGLLAIGDVREKLGLELADEPYDTVGGLVFGRLGRVAAVGDAVNAEGWRFEVTAVDGRRVSQVRARRSGPEAPPLPNR